AALLIARAQADGGEFHSAYALRTEELAHPGAKEEQWLGKMTVGQRVAQGRVAKVLVRVDCLREVFHSYCAWLVNDFERLECTRGVTIAAAVQTRGFS